MLVLADSTSNIILHYMIMLFKIILSVTVLLYYSYNNPNREKGNLENTYLFI